MQQQTKKPMFPQPTGLAAKPKDLLCQVPDISSVVTTTTAKPKGKRTITRCAGCNNPTCRWYPITIEVDE